MKFNISFKKEKKERGLAAVGNPNQATNVKLNKQIVGAISPPSWMTEDSLWRVRFIVVKEDNWKWITMKAKFNSEPEARVWIKENLKAIHDRYTLVPQDDW